MDSVSFSDEFSVYKNNTALQGGAISCTSCKLTLTGNEYDYNMALDGGVIYSDNEGEVSTYFEKYERNTAYRNGGVMFFISRSTFTLQNGKFSNNYA